MRRRSRPCRGSSSTTHERGHTFAASAATPLIRYFEQTDRFGGVSELATDLPINLLLVLPATPDLDLGQERRNIEQIALATEGAARADPRHDGHAQTWPTHC